MKTQRVEQIAQQEKIRHISMAAHARLSGCKSSKCAKQSRFQAAFCAIGLLFCLTLSNSALAQQPNILLIIADDLGLDPVPGYAGTGRKAAMPNLQSLAARGISFDNVWANPLCSPTRASILTGKFGFRTGVLNAEDLSLIAPEEKTLHEFLAESSDGSYRSAIIGKWHLSGRNNPNANYPALVGVTDYAGFLTGGVSDYSNWTLTRNGTQTQSRDYITTAFTNMAIDWIRSQTQPWFLWLAYTAPHSPFHLPPSGMHSQGNLPADQASIDANPLPYYLAMVESLDFEVGRLLASMAATQRDNTVIIFVGDNGTDRRVIQTPFLTTQAKSSLYQGGINVPMVIAGPGVSRSGQRESALINVADLYATIIELTGSRASKLNDSLSFKSLLSTASSAPRKTSYSELGGEGVVNGWAARQGNYKLLETTTRKELFNLAADPYERSNLLNSTLSAEANTALTAITSGVNTIFDAPTIDGSFSGSWYNPDRSGEGLMIELVDLDPATGVISFYTYSADDTGAQLWLVGSGPIVGDTINVDLIQTRGPRFGTTFNPAAVVRTNWGKAQLRFDSCSNATLAYQSVLPAYGSGTIPLVRLTPPLLGVVGACSK